MIPSCQATGKFQNRQENAVSPTETTANLSVETASDAVMDDLILVGIKSGKLSRLRVDLHKAVFARDYGGLRHRFTAIPLDETETRYFLW